MPTVGAGVAASSAGAVAVGGAGGVTEAVGMIVAGAVGEATGCAVQPNSDKPAKQAA